jgi:putative peptidoglycan lipid II flippase
MIKKTFTFSVFVFFSKIFGFLRDILLVYILGINLSSDIFNFSLGFTSIISNILGISIYLHFTSVFSKIDNVLILKKFFLRAIIKLISLIIFVLVLIWSFTPTLLSFYSSIQEQEVYNQTVIIIRQTLVIILFFGISQFFLAYFNSRNRFVLPELSHTSINIFFIVSVLLFKVYDLSLLISYYSFSYLVQTIFLLFYFFFSRKRILNEYSVSNDRLNDKSLTLPKQDLLFIFIIISNILTYFNGFITLSISSRFIGVFVSQNNLAGKINGVVLSVIAGSLIALSYPLLNRVFNKSRELFQIEIVKVIIQLFIFIIPISFFMILFNVEIVSLFFYFDNNLFVHIDDVASILSIYLISSFSVSLIYFFTKVFIVKKDYFYLILSPVLLILLNLVFFYVSEGFLTQYAVPFSFSFSNFLVSLIILFTYREVFSGKIVFLIKRLMYIGCFLLILLLFKQFLDIFLIELNHIQRLLVSTVFFVISFLVHSIFFYRFILKTKNFQSIFDPI